MQGKQGIYYSNCLWLAQSDAFPVKMQSKINFPE
ncbi:hypothetical protein P872_08035 [Rhodonellum psychrophilum GCM71 = DSM 17998]|uniref:Uncharacterized protein n=1 Tax=Rhodonellum psychrophilum GCM71 = DSM 17998 TaxID=1123057 RepID=U5BWK7_9BACT|nr:hypothetical protein P872_08035 [Rhodonellum psychrophilum GCM71 = DSM 17998]